MKLPAEFVRFVLVGGLVFCLDMLICLLLWQVLGWPVVAARVAAFALAALAQWTGHRWFSFRDRQQQSRGAQLLQSLLLASSAALVNLGLFSLLIMLLPDELLYWALSMAIGVLAGMLLNWVGANSWVFARVEADTGYVR
ncbi:GtrA family protein [Shewanella submarina]|uniref:GtrA family protein n=1 Tax=Shewanella submarina TaxID=2016376 RepID=A0ABV7G5T2_9GAMM|nr:GtrA family protein [Shewanella submarina]